MNHPTITTTMISCFTTNARKSNVWTPQILKIIHSCRIRSIHFSTQNLPRKRERSGITPTANMEKKELSELPKNLPPGVPSVIEIKSTKSSCSHSRGTKGRGGSDSPTDLCTTRCLFSAAAKGIVWYALLAPGPGTRKTRWRRLGSMAQFGMSETSACDGRPKKWKCLICKAETRCVCSHPSCQALKRSSSLFGTLLCDHTKSAGGLWK